MLMGLGIAVDVAIATIVQFRDTKMTFRSWTAPVAIAHIMLPAIGYYLWWYLGSASTLLVLPLGLIAFLLITAFLAETFCDWIDVKPFVSMADAMRIFPSASVTMLSAMAGLVAVLAVSMDALWSGPAKAAQIASGHWSTLQVGLSFVVAGTVVGIVAELALIISRWLRRFEMHDISLMSVALVLGKFAEMAVLAAFGILALWNAFGAWVGLGSLFTCLAISSSLSLILWTVFWKRLVVSQEAELRQNIADPLAH